MMFYIILVYIAAFAGGIGYAIYEERKVIPFSVIKQAIAEYEGKA